MNYGTKVFLSRLPQASLKPVRHPVNETARLYYLAFACIVAKSALRGPLTALVIDGSGAEELMGIFQDAF